MTKLTKDAVKRCLSCQMTFDRTYDEPLWPTPLPPDVWHTIPIDFKGPLKDGKYILVAYDLYSRYPVVGYCNSTSFVNVKPVLDSIFATFGKVQRTTISGSSISWICREKGILPSQNHPERW
jgi:hypothetical protein